MSNDMLTLLIILPGTTLALYFLASYARLTRTAMIGGVPTQNAAGPFRKATTRRKPGGSCHRLPYAELEAELQ